MGDGEEGASACPRILLPRSQSAEVVKGEREEGGASLVRVGFIAAARLCLG